MLVSAAALSHRLGNPPLHTDEITYMGCTLESMFQGAVFPIYANGALFYNKPPLALWLMRASFHLLGPSPFAARLPSVLAAVATAVVLYLFAAVVIGEGAGILAAAIFLSIPTPLVLHGLRSGPLDALEILLVSCSIVALELWRRQRRRWMLVGLVACAAATAWVKSPFALAVLVAYLLGSEPFARRAGRGTPNLARTLMLVVGSWCVAYLLWLGILSSHYSPRGVKNRLLKQQYARRIEGRMGAIEGPFYYGERLARDFGPLLLVPAAAAALALARKRGVSNDAACFVVWGLGAPILASVSAGKHPWYLYLSYPGVALVVAISAQAISRRPPVRAAVLGAVVLVAAWRLPLREGWPADSRYHSPVGRLWELTRQHPEIVIVDGPDFQLPRGRDDAYREARLLIRALRWKPPSRASSSQCQGILINSPSEAPAGESNLLELYRPSRPTRGTGLWLVDRCDGCLQAQLSPS